MTKLVLQGFGELALLMIKVCVMVVICVVVFEMISELIASIYINVKKIKRRDK